MYESKLLAFQKQMGIISIFRKYSEKKEGTQCALV